MVEELRRVFEQAQEESEGVQRHIAEVVASALEEAEEAEWDAMLAASGSHAFLAHLVEEAHAEIAAGATHNLDELL